MQNGDKAGLRLSALGAAIRKERKGKGWSQEELAHRAGLNRTYVGLVELGRVNISFENLDKISACFGLRPSWLLDRAGL